MRTAISKLRVDDLPWQPTAAPGLEEKIINTDPESGARTMLLKSKPRPRSSLADLRPQFHPVDEEFLCLSGRFTLEGDPWLTAGTYVYYPPNMVHGHGVDVPGGYEIYLRNSGPVTTERVDDPARNSLYVLGKEDAPSSGATIRQTGEQLDALQNTRAFSIVPLRSTDTGGEGAFLVTMPAGASVTSGKAGCDGFFEIFVLSGGMELGGQTGLSVHDYAFVPPGEPIQVAGLEAQSAAIVTYSGTEVFNLFTRAGAEVEGQPD